MPIILGQGFHPSCKECQVRPPEMLCNHGKECA